MRDGDSDEQEQLHAYVADEQLTGCRLRSRLCTPVVAYIRRMRLWPIVRTARAAAATHTSFSCLCESGSTYAIF